MLHGNHLIPTLNSRGLDAHRLFTASPARVLRMQQLLVRRMRATLIGLTLILVGSACGTSDDTTTSVASTAAPSTAQAEAATTETATEPSATSAATDPTSSDDASAPADSSTLAGVDAAQWADNVDITIGDGSFTFVSDGIPNHELPDQFLVPKTGNMPPFDGDDIADEFEIADTDGLIVESPLDVEITLNPFYSDEVTLTSLSTIGVMISGAPLFNDYEDQGREFVAVDDNISLDGVFFIDACNGHPLATGDSYHYHGVPYCITDDVDVAGQHSTIIGVLRDGFPIYGPQDVDGSSMTNADLDECSGHEGVTPEFPEGIYHYHLTEDAAPYSIDCYHGVIDDAGNGNQGAGGQAGGPPPGRGDQAGGPPPDGAQPGGGAPDFTDAAALLGVTVAELEAALGQPPFDLDAAAATLGIDAQQLADALPAPPDGAPPGA